MYLTPGPAPSPTLSHSQPGHQTANQMHPKMHRRGAVTVELVSKSKELLAESTAYGDELVASVNALIAEKLASISASLKVRIHPTLFLPFTAASLTPSTCICTAGT